MKWHVCTYICTYVHTYTHTYLRTYIHMYVCMYVCMDVCMYVMVQWSKPCCHISRMVTAQSKEVCEYIKCTKDQQMHFHFIDILLFIMVTNMFQPVMWPSSG